MMTGWSPALLFRPVMRRNKSDVSVMEDCSKTKIIPVSVLVVTKNEERHIERCLQSLDGFGEVIVIDSYSQDRTQDIARACGAQVIDFEWNGQYPKKRQWCLDHLSLQYDWVFWVDADECVTDGVKHEIRALDFKRSHCAGYYVSAQYAWQEQVLRFGLRNKKIALFHKDRMVFPVVNDLDIPGMGEIEGHYQPVAVDTDRDIGALKHPMLHYACEDMEAWERRHERYAQWEREMDRRGTWPDDGRLRKKIFRVLPFKSLIAFLHSYILNRGILDGRAGFSFAAARYRYYRMLSSKTYS